MEPNTSAPAENAAALGPHCIGFRLLFRLLWRSLVNTRDTAAPLTRKRLGVLCLLLPMAFPLLLIHRVALLLDNVFFPGFRDVRVKEPVFMVGIPRSGTTFLYHLLSKDEENFTSFNLWEIIFAPSILERYFWTFIGRLDAFIGGPGYRLAVRIENRVFAEVRKIHYFSLFKPDEDEQILTCFFANTLVLFAFPFPEELWALIEFDTEMAPPLKRQIMGIYKDCVKRHLYFHGPNKHFLAKNPTHSSKIDALGATFPGARIVCNVRTPYDAAPSLMSLLSFFWGVFGNDKQQHRLREMSLDVIKLFYRHPIERLAQWPEERHAFVKYQDLAREPENIVRVLYKRFGLNINETFARQLSKEQERASSYKSPHAYSMDQYELTPERILEEFGDIFAHFGFDTGHVG